MDYLMQADIHRLVKETLAQLGKPHADLSCLNMKVLTRDGYIVGHAIQYEDVRIVLSTSEDRIEFYGADEALLRTVTVEQDGSQRPKAA